MYERENARRLILIGIGVVAVVVVAGLIFFLTRGSGSSASTTATAATPVTSTQIVVALQPIPQGTQLNASQVPTYFGVSSVPVADAPPAAYTTLDQIQALMASAPQNTVTVTQTIFQKSTVVPGMFSTLGEFRTAPTASFVIPYGYVAVAISFDPINSVLNSISAGDDIDLIGSLKAPTTPCGKAQPVTNPMCGLHPEAQTQFVMTDVRVISVNNPPPVTAGSAPAPAGAGIIGTGTPLPTAVPTATPVATTAGGTLLLLLRYQQALELQHLKDFGWQLSAVLRSAKQQTLLHLKTLPVTDKWFFVKTQTPLKANPGY
jgi:Flp pilus assembly protein CpaB